MKWDTNRVKVIKDLGLKMVVPLPKQYAVNSLRQGEWYTLEIKKKRKKRSLNANSYAWILCQKIAKKIGITKEDIYKKAVYESGDFVPVKIRKDLAATLISNWKAKGLGWLAVKESETEDGVILQLYHGSSVYNTAEMTRLIESLLQECYALKIDTLSESNIKNMLEEWE